jgi:sialidase-1
MGDIAQGRGNEVQVVELANGDVMLNARNYWGKIHRVVGISHDQGLTWDRSYEDKTLIESYCMASFIRYAFGTETEKSMILFSNPASKKDRTNVTLRVSFDEGRTWPDAFTIDPGRFAYSCLARLPSGAVGCLYETGEKSGHDQITFICINLERKSKTKEP